VTFDGGNVWQQSPRETNYCHIIRISQDHRLTSLLRFAYMTSGTERIEYFSFPVSAFLSFDSNHRQGCRQMLPTEDTKTKELTWRGRNLQSTPSNGVNVLRGFAPFLLFSRYIHRKYFHGKGNLTTSRMVAYDLKLEPQRERSKKSIFSIRRTDKKKRFFVRTPYIFSWLLF